MQFRAEDLQKRLDDLQSKSQAALEAKADLERQLEKSQQSLKQAQQQRYSRAPYQPASLNHTTLDLQDDHPSLPPYSCQDPATAQACLDHGMRGYLMKAAAFLQVHGLVNIFLACTMSGLHMLQSSKQDPVMSVLPLQDG